MFAWLQGFAARPRSLWSAIGKDVTSPRSPTANFAISVSHRGVEHECAKPFWQV